MSFAVEVTDLTAEQFDFTQQKTMYSGKAIAEVDSIFIFASENEGGLGLIAADHEQGRRHHPRGRCLPS